MAPVTAKLYLEKQKQKKRENEIRIYVYLFRLRCVSFECKTFKDFNKFINKEKDSHIASIAYNMCHAHRSKYMCSVWRMYVNKDFVAFCEIWQRCV